MTPRSQHGVGNSAAYYEWSIERIESDGMAGHRLVRMYDHDFYSAPVGFLQVRGMEVQYDAVTKRHSENAIFYFA